MAGIGLQIYGSKWGGALIDPNNWQKSNSFLKFNVIYTERRRDSSQIVYGTSVLRMRHKINILP